MDQLERPPFTPTPTPIATTSITSEDPEKDLHKVLSESNLQANSRI